MKASCRKTATNQVAVLITVLGNLIENALEALGQEPGGEISVSLHYRHGWLHCEVNDDGQGIAPEHIEHASLRKAFRQKEPNGALV